MCGLAGMIGRDIEKPHREMFLDLLGVTYLRGRHSTGIFTASPLGKKDFLKMKKLTVSSPIFIDLDLNDKNSLLKDTWSDLVMGHCRSATVGDITKENSHPFDTPSLVGAHNGTLNDYWSWGNKGTADEDKTDSQIMFERMDKKGVAEVLKDTSPTSAWAVSIYMKKTRKLILARNKHRPLYVGFDENAGVMFWSSEYDMLHFAAERNNIKLKIYHLEKNKMYTIDPEEVKKGEDAPWEITEVPEKTYQNPGYVWKKKDGTSSSVLINEEVEPWGDVPFVAVNENDLSNEQCCICDRQLTVKDVNNLVPVDVDGIKYFCCESCSQDTKEALKRETDEHKIKESGVQSRLIDSYGNPIH